MSNFLFQSQPASGSSGGSDFSSELLNLTIAASVGSNALTVALKNKAGNDPSVGDPVSVSFRSATITSGSYVVRSITAATSLVVTSGSTLGTTSAKQENIFVYLVDNGGSVELGVSLTLFDEGYVRSTTAEGGAGGADTATILYATSTLSDKAIRLIGVITATEATAGTWATAPSLVTIRTGRFYVWGSRQVFATAAAHTWTRPLGNLAVNVRVIGAGGGGGGVSNAAAMAAGGGGGGGYAEEFITRGLGASETATVGAGGTAGSTAGGDGGTGNTSSFGSFCQATGGAGGIGRTAAGASAGGSGGAGSGGDINFNGNGGGASSSAASNIHSGAGGAAPFSAGGAKGEPPNATGNAGVSGGGGAGGAGNSAARAGGAGGDGYIIVDEFY